MDNQLKHMHKTAIRLFAFCILFIVMLSSFANSKSKLDSIPNNITGSKMEALVDKYGTPLVERFDTLIEKSVPVAEEGFSILVRLQIVKGILSGLVPVFITICLLVRLNSINKRGGLGENANTIITIFLLFLSLISLAGAYEGFQRLVVPEWFAILELFNLVK